MLRKAVNLVTLAHYVLMNKNTPVLSFDYDLDDHKAYASARCSPPKRRHSDSSTAEATSPKPS